MNARRNTTKKISLAELEALRRERDLVVVEDRARERLLTLRYQKKLKVGAARLSKEIAAFSEADFDDLPPAPKRSPSDSGFGASVTS